MFPNGSVRKALALVMVAGSSVNEKSTAGDTVTGISTAPSTGKTLVTLSGVCATAVVQHKTTVRLMTRKVENLLTHFITPFPF
jgi:hypothetical protein